MHMEVKKDKNHRANAQVLQPTARKSRRANPMLRQTLFLSFGFQQMLGNTNFFLNFPLRVTAYKESFLPQKEVVMRESQ